MQVALLGLLVGAVVGACAGFVAAVAIQLLKGVRNRIMARRGAGQLKDMVLLPLGRPGALVGGVVGAALAPIVGLDGAALGAAAPALALVVVAIPATLWVACTIAPIDREGGPPGAR